MKKYLHKLKKLKNIKKRIWIPIAVLAVVLVAGGITFETSDSLREKLISPIAHYEVTKCANERDHAGCYENNVPNLLKYLSVRDVFNVIHDIQGEDRSYQFCHVLAHKLGGIEVEKDPNNWVNVLHENPPDGYCSNGFIHGAIVARFSESEMTTAQINAIVPDLSRACEPVPGWNPTSLDQAMCYHGMGHVLTYLTTADLPLASDFCDKVAIKSDGEDFRRVCVSGVYMQIFQPLEPDDYVLIENLKVKPTKDNLASFCGAQPTEEEKSLCFSEGWPLFRDQLRTAQGVQNFCNQTSAPKLKEDCYQAVFAIGARGSLFQPQVQGSLCTQLPVALGKECFQALSAAFIEENKSESPQAVAVCTNAPDAYKDDCLSSLLSKSAFYFGNNANEIQRFCQSLPEPYAQQCSSNPSLRQASGRENSS